MSWSCAACTYANPGAYLACEMCSTPRDVADVGGRPAKRFKETARGGDDGGGGSGVGGGSGGGAAGGASLNGNITRPATSTAADIIITVAVRGPTGTKRIKISASSPLGELRKAIATTFSSHDSSAELSDSK